MDPRHPELAVSRIKELIKQYDRIEKDMAEAATSAQLGQLEREGGLVVQEICLVAPRIHEAMMQASRQRRHDLSRGNIYDQMREYAATAERVDEPVEKPVVELVKDNADVIGEENIGGESGPVKKAATKKVTKKKTTKKAKK